LCSPLQLVNVFQSSLERCVSPGSVTTTGTPNYTLTTATTPGNRTTTAQSTTGSDNTTTASTAVTLNSTTTATLEGNKTTTPDISNTATTTFTNNTTIATTAFANNTTTAATTLKNNTTTTTTPETSNTPKATTTLPESSNTTTATTTTPKSSTITTATTFESNNTTATTLEASSTTTATTTTPATTRLEGSSLTTATTTTTLEGSSLTTTTTTATPITTLEGSSLTTTTTTTPATTITTLEGSSLTTTTTTTPATTTTTLEGSSLTTTTTTKKSSTTTATTTTTPATTPQKGSSTTTTAKKSSTTTDTTTTPKGQTNKSQGNSSASNNNKRRRRSVRLGRDVGSGVTQSSDTSTGLFQNLGISCAAGVSATSSCSVTLRLQQPVPSCCILRTLCAASAASSNVSAVGRRAHRDLPQSSCPGAPQEETSCSYAGPANSSCGASDAAYVGGQTNSSSCAPVPPTSVCSCSSYCSNTDSYYAFQVSLLDPDLTASYVSSLISQTLKQAQNCSPSSTDPCPLLVVGANYKDASVTCGVDVANRQNCSVILRFAVEVPVCSVAAAATQAFQSRAQISFNGSVNRTAMCGNSSVGGSSWSSQVTWVSVPVPSATFCAAVEQFTSLVCASGGNVVVWLDEACDQASTTTAQPNTTSPVNTTTATTTSVGVTVTTLNTATPAANVSATTATASAESRAGALLEQSRDASKLDASQIDLLLAQLESLLSGPNVSLALGNTSVSIVSNLLNASPAQVARSSNRIIGIVDTVGLKLVLGAAAQTLLSPSVALSVKRADGGNFQETFFSISDPSNVQIRGIPRLGRSARTSSVPQGSVTLPSSLTHNLSPQQQQQVTRVQFSFYQKSTVFQDKSLGRRVLNSGILGASVANLSISGLNDNVVITLRNAEPVPANFVASCVFWDFTLNNGSGGWNPSGCVVQNGTDNTTTVCGCNHLTSFAVLLDPFEKFSPSPLQNTILTYITYIGCGISAIFLSVTLLTYLSFEKLRKDVPSKILIHLCFALLLLNLVFLVDAWLALYTSAVGLCISTACFLHYFLLASFTWMGLEAVHMYNALVKVFNNNMSRYLLKFSLVGWGVPMVVVIIVVAIKPDNYGLMSYGKFADGRSDDFCWLRSDVAFYVAVVAYFCVIFLFNLSMFVVVLMQLCRIKRQNPHNARHRSTLQDARSVAGITVLLGLTWGFAFFAWGPVNLAFMYLFAIFNSLQGFFIFVFYCAAKENVRRQWRVYLCCGNMRLAENSDWSRTATQKTMKPVGNLKASQSSQSNSSSSSTSFLVTDSTEQSGSFSSPMDDREITAHEDASEDVILNEINRQNRNHRAS
ncbi:mucin-22, partial [Betta splendens]|uniref:Adhesion G-protein coupled receptor G2 n=1 Tax=Betta splendens TaxID=158456 RepID=A0A6P7PM87_BETSP